MIRLLGFLLGSAVVAALLAAWFSWEGRLEPAAFLPPTAESPDFRSGTPSDSVADPGAASPDEGPRGPRAEPDEPGEPEPAAGAEVFADGAATHPAPPPPQAETTPATSRDTGTAAAAGGPGAEAVVWRPFRSERAAQGFATHLTQRYGASADVRRDGPGLYRVTLSAPDAASLANELERLRAETGMKALEAGP